MHIYAHVKRTHGRGPSRRAERLWYLAQMDAHGFLVALTIVLGVAAVTTVVFQKLRQPVVLGYILAGLIIGPNVPIPLVADRQIIETLSELGVILLMFSLGLEFSLGKLMRLGPTASVTAVLQSSLMIWLGRACILPWVVCAVPGNNSRRVDSPASINASRWKPAWHTSGLCELQAHSLSQTGLCWKMLIPGDNATL